ncbi:MAG: hypothetical protein SFX19_09415 [Alphaproteobacteria bacterium]|nr:hypothetical protein [Alphaproteobacteria bacterium]
MENSFFSSLGAAFIVANGAIAGLVDRVAEAAQLASSDSAIPIEQWAAKLAADAPPSYPSQEHNPSNHVVALPTAPLSELLKGISV